MTQRSYAKSLILLVGPPGLEPGTKGIMRADIQRKPLGFQELTSLNYRCVSICVTRLTRLQKTLAHSLIFKTTGILDHSEISSDLKPDSPKG
jgi:hypothetical protein